jgi:predicted kinase
MTGPALLIQMSGAPGCGKSTLARLAGRRVGAVVLDHDTIKTALIDSGMPPGHGDPLTDPEGLGGAPGGAGQAAYEIAFALANSWLTAQVSTVLDSPCYYEWLLRRGQRLAHAVGATYRYVECVNNDLAELERRLRDRPHLRSQCTGLAPPESHGSEVDGGEVDGRELFRAWAAGMRRPAAGYLRVDTGRPTRECVAAVLAYLDPPAAGRRETR